MKRILMIYRRIIMLVGKYLPILFGVLSIAIFILSFHTRSYQSIINHEVRKVERNVHKRQALLDEYVVKAINTPNNQWLDFDVPEDLVIYKYCGDTIQSWINGFPISNDEVDVYPFLYRLQYMSNGNLFSTPLAYIGMEESYVNFGSAWYIVNTQIDPITRAKVIGGILVRTEYEAEGISNIVNEHLSIDAGFMTVPVTTDDSAVIYGNEGNPLFSIVPTDNSVLVKNNMIAKWIAIILGIFALYIYHWRKHTSRSFAVLVSGILLIRFVVALLVPHLSSTEEIFSPVLYASNFISGSLGEFLLNSLAISIIVYGIYIIRYDIYRKFVVKSKRSQRITALLFVAVEIFLIAYILLSLHSLIVNSNIVLEPVRLNELNKYSVLCFISLALLYLALLLTIQMGFISLRLDKRRSTLSWKGIVLYVVAISLYTVSAIGISSMRKEYETGRVWTNKLAVERDLNLELQLMTAEQAIATDPFMAMLTSVDNRDFLLRRLLERYMPRGIDQKYNIELTVCSPNNLLMIGGGADPVGCFPFYQDQIQRYGVPLTGNGLFFFMNNYDGQTSYLGVFTYVDFTTMIVNRLFIEINSKFTKNSTGYDLFSGSSNYQVKLPKQYSYARYSNNRLVQYGGDYNYPVQLNQDGETAGYKRVVKNGYIHFINYLSDGEITIVSRVTHQFLSYIVSFSYFVIFFGLFIVVTTHRSRRKRIFNLPRHSLRRKITMLTTLSMVAALLSMGAASIIYNVKSKSETTRDRLESTIQTVSSSLSNYCKYVNKYVELNNMEFVNGISEIAGVAQVDINIYDTHGGLIRTTKPEVFDQYYMGKRMNNKAYHEIAHNHTLKYIAVETIANIRYFSIYAPLFNADGEMVAIVNVPYFSDAEDLNEATTSAMSTIINLYLILLLSAIIIATIVSNSMSRPLAEIKRRMESLSASGKNAHINYNNTSDELGVLVTAYNNMVDDLEESTRQLARSEREQAWKEMARQIAHEIKNPLTPMRLSIQHLMRLKKANVDGWEQKFDELSSSLLDQIDILSETASQFSSFAKMFNEDISDVNITSLIRENIVLFSSNDSVNIEYVNSVTEDPIVEVREKQLSRVFVNLITNAIQALDGVSDGMIRIHLSEDGNNYILDFEDNGPGVADENLSKLFKPNFTTKSSGTGLGLAISYNIIEQCRGRLSYRRSSLGGACFSICLPKKVTFVG